MVKVAKSGVADRNIGLPAFHLCYSLEVALNSLAIGGIGSEKKTRHVLVGGGCIPLIPPSGSAPGSTYKRWEVNHTGKFGFQLRRDSNANTVMLVSCYTVKLIY